MSILEKLSSRLKQRVVKQKKYGRTYREHLIALYIHGLAHLKGYDHSDEMDAYEASLHSFLARYLKNK
ncbi:MAG: rRNA maturation RNAse YbeY [Candidatus Pacebacteria bacterium]|nr:rRNA maturation RNAse YbeY [Candidatus Paceibacterota bacterium]